MSDSGDNSFSDIDLENEISALQTRLGQLEAEKESRNAASHDVTLLNFYTRAFFLLMIILVVVLCWYSYVNYA
jgi:hypothetical protein